MSIADGVHLWCGGRNLAAEYFAGDPRPILGCSPWVDLSFDLFGDVAAQAQQQFEQDWAFAGERPAPADAPVSAASEPEPGVKALAQLVASGPDQPDDTIFTLLVSGCFTSQRRILAVTPYFVPDTALLTALSLAARRGIAGRPDPAGEVQSSAGRFRPPPFAARNWSPPAPGFGCIRA